MTILVLRIFRRLLPAALLGLLAIYAAPVIAQRVSSDIDPFHEYQVGLELFQKSKYGAAQNSFSDALEHRAELPIYKMENAEYYMALSALMLYNADGEGLMLSFLDHHPEHQKAEMAHYQLGRYYFSKKRYRSELEQFALVGKLKMDAAMLEEFYFKKGYAHFQQEQYDESREALGHVVESGRTYRSAAVYYNAYIAYMQNRNEEALTGFQELEGDKLFGNVVPFYILQIYYRQSKNEDVISFGNELIQKEFAQKKSGEIHKMIGEARYALGQFDEAVPELEKAISELGGDRQDRYELAYAAYRGGDFDKAVGYFKQIVTKEDALSQLAYYHLADCFLKLDRKMEARDAFRAASKYAFDQELKEDALFNFAKLAYELSFDPYNEAVQAFEEYIQKNPNSNRKDEAYGFLLKVYLTTKNYESALQSIDKMSDKTDELKRTYQRIAYLRGAELFRDRQFKKAKYFFKTSDRYRLDLPIAAQSTFWQAESDYRMKRWKAAEHGYLSFIESPGAISLPEYGLGYYGIGYVYFENSKLDSAILWFRKFVDIEKSDTMRINDALLRIADAYYLSKDNSSAIAYYDKAIKLGRFDTDYAIFQIAVCYGIQGQNASKVETLKAMLENYPETDFAADADYEIAETYFFTDESQKAMTYFDKVIAEHPHSQYVRKAKLNKGMVFYNQSLDKDALPLFKEVAEDYPATEEANQALLRIKNIYVESGDVPGFETYVKEQDFPDITKGALDTSYYESAQHMYQLGQLTQAIKAFDAYNQNFPHGYFSLNANFYAGEAAFELEQYDQAIGHYDKVLGFAKNAFTERSLMAAAEIYFHQKKYDDALIRFTMLEELAEVTDNLISARAGLMRCNYLLNNFSEADEYAQKLRKSDKVPEAVLNEASLTSAKCALAQNNQQLAKARFQETLLEANNAMGAESMYNLARIAFLEKDFEKSKKMIFEMVNIFPTYGSWISKSLLLLADVYLGESDIFQAKVTVQNLIDNYDGETKEKAIEKMKQIKALEPELKQPQQSQNIDVQFEQEGNVPDDIFQPESEQGPIDGNELEIDENNKKDTLKIE